MVNANQKKLAGIFASLVVALVSDYFFFVFVTVLIVGCSSCISSDSGLVS
jgi:hypothetical protein